MVDLKDLIEKRGPSRSSIFAEVLQNEFKLNPEAARKRLSRVAPPIRSFPIGLLPKKEAFLYLQEQRTTERFWTQFHRDLRATNSIYGAALDALAARGGIVSSNEFAVISGAPIALKKQICVSDIAEKLEKSDFIKNESIVGIGECYRLARPEIAICDFDGFHARRIAEGVILDGVREWARKLGLASYNSIAIRGDEHARKVGPFVWDLTGPSYLLPLRGKQQQQGFLVADVFSEGTLDEFQIRYFIRKVQLLKASVKGGGSLAFLIAEGFTPNALKIGHGAGIILATPSTLFGQKVGNALKSLLATLKKAAAVASSDPTRLTQLITELSEIEGAAGNLRGILFQLIAAYLARSDASSIDVGITVRHPETGKLTDIDIVKVIGKNQCVGIECKGKIPGGTISVAEVEKWLENIPAFRYYFTQQSRFREAEISFELWTSGTFQEDALALLNSEKVKRTKTPISWKDGVDLALIASNTKEKTIKDALYEHYLKHPLTK